MQIEIESQEIPVLHISRSRTITMGWLKPCKAEHQLMIYNTEQHGTYT